MLKQDLKMKHNGSSLIRNELVIMKATLNIVQIVILAAY